MASSAAKRARKDSDTPIWKNKTYTKGFGKRAMIKRLIQEQKKREDVDDSFMLFDLGDVFKKVRKWKKNLPMVTPFFAVKCNPDENVIRILSAMECGFDCASKGELQLLRETIGVSPERIINANTWKQASHIQYAKEQEVKMMTFDCEEELDKVKKIHPEAELVLRLSIYDDTADLPFGIKFGCKIDNAQHLLKKAKKLNLNIVGVSFHIGSGSRNPPIFQLAIGQARKVFDEGAKLGYKMDLLDIGGGFPGKKNMAEDDIEFEEFAKAVKLGLQESFPTKKYGYLHVIAEPGRYFNESAGTLVVNVYGKRRKTHPEDEYLDDKPGLEGRKYKGFDYFVNNGIFSSFGRNLIDYGEVPPTPVDEKKLKKKTFPTTVYGNTCAEMDYCNEECELPELNIGDWLYYEDIGAYHCINEGTFNGFKPPQKFDYVLPDKILAFVEQLRDDNAHPKGKPWQAVAKRARGAAQKFFSKFDDDDDDDYSLNDD